MRYIIASEGSEASLKAARFLVQHSCPEPEDEIFVIYVFPLPLDLRAYGKAFGLPTDAGDERIRELARSVIERTKDALDGTRARIEEVVLVGNPAREIVEFATNMRADLVVTGWRRHSADDELYLGSVSNALAHRAPCSVLVVR